MGNSNLSGGYSFLINRIMFGGRHGSVTKVVRLGRSIYSPLATFSSSVFWVLTCGYSTVSLGGQANHLTPFVFVSKNPNSET